MKNKSYRKQEGKETVISEMSERIWIRHHAVMGCIRDVICPDMTVLQYGCVLRLL
ncbi:MAG: hypothetical protein WCY62_04775 [Clostridia bacterium]|jgi:hypothetical protein